VSGRVCQALRPGCAFPLGRRWSGISVTDIHRGVHPCRSARGRPSAMVESSRCFATARAAGERAERLNHREVQYISACHMT